MPWGQSRLLAAIVLHRGVGAVRDPVRAHCRYLLEGRRANYCNQLRRVVMVRSVPMMHVLPTAHDTRVP